MAQLFLVGAIAGIVCFWLGFILACIFHNAKEQDRYFDDLEDEFRYFRRDVSDSDSEEQKTFAERWFDI